MGNWKDASTSKGAWLFSRSSRLIRTLVDCLDDYSVIKESELDIVF
jgi:hypothetical protein